MQNRTMLSLAAAVFLAPLLAGAPAAQQPQAQGQPAQGQGPQAQQNPNPNAQGAPTTQGAEQGRGRGQAGGGRGRAAGPPPGPAPRNAAGRALLNEKGVWIGGGGVGGRGADVPYQPWTRAVAADRRVQELEPHTRCKASGFQRQFLTPYGAEIIEVPDLHRVFIFDIGGPHTFRTIYTDGRSHPKNLQPTYYGHSIGWWEGDTLVVDTVGYNEGFWIDRGVAPHTDALHTVEKFTRIDSNNIRYDLTIDDPGAYTKPWGGTMNLRLERGTDLFEYVCQQQNYAHELMVGQFKTIDRTTLPVP